MSNAEHLQLFARQLANWTEQMIENGRTPFRRVDLFCPLQTANGLCHPPLIVWINRRSFIAGGVIFLPDSTNLKTDYSDEAAAAEALGLRHFVCWEDQQVRIFESDSAGTRVIATHPLGQGKDPFFFQHRLNDLLEQLKLLSVTGRIETSALSSFYLVNLLNETLLLAEPALVDMCRTAHSHLYETRSCEQIGKDWNRLTLLRLLCVLHWQDSIENLTLEDLQNSLAQKLRQLPEPLSHLLLNLQPLPQQELPQESKVAFHHLLLRLKQLNWQAGSAQSQQVLRALLSNWFATEPVTTNSENRRRRLIHAPWLAPQCGHETSTSAALLAASAIVRILDGQPHPLQQWGDSFSFHKVFKQQHIEAHFCDNRRPETSQRRALLGHLRTSWPNRHLHLAGHLPYWVFEATHLLGLCPEQARICLNLPSNWLSRHEGSFFCELLFSHFVITHLWVKPRDSHQLLLERRTAQILTRCRLVDGSERHLELDPVPPVAARDLFYALALSREIFAIYQQQRLIVLTESRAQAFQPAALDLYAGSKLGRHLWKMRGQKPLPEKSAEVLATGIELGWLVPEPALAQEIQQQITAQSDGADIDHILAGILGLPLDFCGNLAPNSRPVPIQPTDAGAKIESHVPQDLLKQLEAEGIPTFPQTYLYRHATGSLKHYHFAAPLRIAQELLGEYQLVDAEGQILQVSGEETKDALMLASILNLSEIEIPQDRQQTADILDSYQRDLQKLKDRVEHLCYSHTSQSAAAQRLLKKIWQQLPLPPLKQLSN